jgi:hypothetical protein
MYDLKLSRRLTLIKPSQAVSRVSWLKLTDVSGTMSVPYSRAVIMRTEMVSETSVIFNQLTRLIAREGFKLHNDEHNNYTPKILLGRSSQGG